MNPAKHISKLMSPKIDFAFKLIFGDQKHKDITIVFLTAVLNTPEGELADIEIINSELLREYKEDKNRVYKKLFEIYAVLGTVQYSPKGMGHTADGHQPIEQDGAIMTGDNNAINISLRWSCQRDGPLGLLICRAYRRYQPHRGVMSIAKIKN